MLLVVYNELIVSHGCWGEREVYRELRIKECENIHDWLFFRQENNVEFICMYEVYKKIDEKSETTF